MDEGFAAGGCAARRKTPFFPPPSATKIPPFEGFPAPCKRGAGSGAKGPLQPELPKGRLSH